MKIVLASQSPRRRELLLQLGITFDVAVKDVDESFPEGLDPVAVVRHIAEKKARAFMGNATDELVIAADTIVTIDGRILGKPRDASHAIELLGLLSGRNHEVITAVAITHKGNIELFHEVTAVYFRHLRQAEIDHYVRQYRPFDKAGAYGIQEWIGLAAIEKIVGSYTNVVGLPTERLYRWLQTHFPDAIIPLT